MMITFREANQAKLALKMMLSNYSWFLGAGVESDGDEYIVVINASRNDNLTKRTIPVVHDGVAVKTNINGRK